MQEREDELKRQEATEVAMRNVIREVPSLQEKLDDFIIFYHIYIFDEHMSTRRTWI